MSPSNQNGSNSLRQAQGHNHHQGQPLQLRQALLPHQLLPVILLHSHMLTQVTLNNSIQGNSRGQGALLLLLRGTFGVLE
jgi:hypothetical protein